MTAPRTNFWQYGFAGTAMQARDFFPDVDSCTDEELAAHDVATKTGSVNTGGCKPIGNSIVCEAPWGIGGCFYRTMYRDEQRQHRRRRMARKRRRGWA